MTRNIVKILIGIVMLVSVAAGYLPQPQYIYEMTCISNATGGVLLIVDAIFCLCGKKGVPDVIMINVSVCILSVFTICMGSLTGLYGPFNFADVFFLLHVVTPLAFVVCYLFMCGRHQNMLLDILVSPIMMLAYLLFDYIRCQFVGEFVYGLVEPKLMTIPCTFVVAVIVYAVMCLFALLLTAIRRLANNTNKEIKPINRNIQKN